MLLIFQPLSVSLGYGFTVFWSRAQNRSGVYGCGLNTSRQLGIQSNPDDPGKICFISKVVCTKTNIRTNDIVVSKVIIFIDFLLIHW